MNSESSRSHMCCTISVRLREKDESHSSLADTSEDSNIGGVPIDEQLRLRTTQGHTTYVTSKFHLVDLAGSEMVSWTIKQLLFFTIA